MPADGSQVLVTWALQTQLGFGDSFSMIAEEDSTDLTAKEGGAAMLARITQLVNEAISEACKSGLLSAKNQSVLSEKEVLQ